MRPVHERLLEKLKASPKLFADETTALDSRRGKTKTGQFWAYARDDRPWNGSDPPGVAYFYAPDRKAERPIAHLADQAELEPWLREKLGLISQTTKLAEAIRYTLSRWEGLARFLYDGRIEIDSSTVEWSIRPIALNRKNALFAGSDGGANNVEPLGYLADVLTRIVKGHPNSQIDDILPWAYIVKPEPKA